MDKKLIIIKVILDWIKERNYQESNGGMILPPLKIPYGNFINEGLSKEDVNDIMETLKESGFLRDGDTYYTAAIEEDIRLAKRELSDYALWEMSLMRPPNYEEVKKMLEAPIGRHEQRLQEFLEVKKMFLFVYPNIEKLLAEYKKYYKKEKTKVGNGEKVNIIEIGEKYGKVYINKDYDHPIEPRDSRNENKYWEKIKNIAKGKDVIYDKGVVRYFNNIYNPICNKLGYEKTTILGENADLMEAVIKIKIITDEQINRSKGQKNKK